MEERLLKHLYLRYGYVCLMNPSYIGLKNARDLQPRVYLTDPAYKEDLEGQMLELQYKSPLVIGDPPPDVVVYTGFGEPTFEPKRFVRLVVNPYSIRADGNQISFSLEEDVIHISYMKRSRLVHDKIDFNDPSVWYAPLTVDKYFGADGLYFLKTSEELGLVSVVEDKFPHMPKFIPDAVPPFEDGYSRRGDVYYDVIREGTYFSRRAWLVAQGKNVVGWSKSGRPVTVVTIVPHANQHLYRLPSAVGPSRHNLSGWSMEDMARDVFIWSKKAVVLCSMGKRVSLPSDSIPSRITRARERAVRIVKEISTEVPQSMGNMNQIINAVRSFSDELEKIVGQDHQWMKEITDIMISQTSALARVVQDKESVSSRIFFDTATENLLKVLGGPEKTQYFLGWGGEPPGKEYWRESDQDLNSSGGKTGVAYYPDKKGEYVIPGLGKGYKRMLWVKETQTLLEVEDPGPGWHVFPTASSLLKYKNVLMYASTNWNNWSTAYGRSDQMYQSKRGITPQMRIRTKLQGFVMQSWEDGLAEKDFADCWDSDPGHLLIRRTLASMEDVVEVSSKRYCTLGVQTVLRFTGDVRDFPFVAGKSVREVYNYILSRAGTIQLSGGPELRVFGKWLMKSGFYVKAYVGTGVLLEVWMPG